MVILLGACLAISRLGAQSNPPTITYQGRLSESGEPVSGAFDLRFTLFDAAEAGAALTTVLRTNVMVDQGLFTVSLNLDVEPIVFAEGGHWFEISTKPAESPEDMQVLQPRQAISAVPHALFAPFASEATWSQTARETAPGAVTSDAIVEQAISAQKIAPGTVVRSINDLTDEVTLVPGAHVSLEKTPGGLRISAVLPDNDFLAVSNTLWVDPVYGDDATASRGLLDRPWLTLSNALAALEDGDRLVVRPGVYSVDRMGMPDEAGNYTLEHARAPLLLKGRSGITIDAGGAVISAPGLGSVFSITDCTNVVIRGLRFAGPGANPVIPTQVAGEIVLWGTNSNLMFDHCQFEDFPNHGILASQKEKTSFDTIVRDCVFRRGGTLQHGSLGLDGAAVASLGPGMKVLGCTFEDVVRAVEVEGSFNSRPIGPVLIANNLMRNFWSAGIIVIPGNYQYLNDIHISDNIILGDRQVRPGAVYQIGVRAHGGSRISVVGNNIGRCETDGINLTALAPLVDVFVANNTCWENGARNIAVLNRFSQVRNAVITGNLCTRNGESASIEVNGENISITDNTLIGGTGPAISATVVPGFSTRHVLITGNRFNGNEASLISIGVGVEHTVVRDNLATIPNPRVADDGSDTEKDQAFLNRARSFAPTTQSPSHESQILPNAYNIRVAGLDEPVTLLTTPTIPPGLDGQLLCILGTSNDYTVTLQDQNVLADSSLGLGAPERTLGRGNILTLRYDEVDAIWWEVSFSDKETSTPQ